MAFCSAVTLCFASIFSLVSAALLAIAFSTDNWQNISVRRENLQVCYVVVFIILDFWNETKSLNVILDQFTFVDM